MKTTAKKVMSKSKASAKPKGRKFDAKKFESTRKSVFNLPKKAKEEPGA